MTYAQSNITLYGLLDGGITYTNNQNGHSVWQQSSGSISGNRWGLRGAEDLGGGAKALFTLENGFSIHDGALTQNNREFGRQAFMGLSHNVYGALTLGRQYDSVVTFLGPLSGIQYGGTRFAHPFHNDNLNNSFRINNSIKYQSSNYKGFNFSALYGFSNSTDFANNRAYSIGASYHYANLSLAAAYLQLNNDLSALAQTVSDSGAVAGDWIFAARRQQTWGAGLNYAIGQINTGFVFTQTRLADSASIRGGQAGTSHNISLNGDARFNNYEINGRYLITPAWSIAASYTYTDSHLADANPNWNQFNLLIAYAFSKRTDVYLQSEYQKINADGLNLGAHLNGIGPTSSTNKQIAVTAGLRHRF